ncbi:hypothetical protein [Proteus faecis]|uniref:hypothetical protein n=1 Tax=Proteus faecis TaxID=2050967 RepID=UPI003075D9C3
MRNTLFNANELYGMIKHSYLNMFPVEPEKYLNNKFTNIYINTINIYLYNKNVPVTITFNDDYLNDNENKAFEDNLIARKNPVKISKLPPEEQESIIDYIDNDLESQLYSIVADMMDMHNWLLLNGYLNTYILDNKKYTYITEKYIKTSSIL